MKTAELIGSQLDWAAAKAEGLKVASNTPAGTYTQERGWFEPTTDWAQGGPIIQREEISVEREYASKDTWAAWTPAPRRDDSEAFGYGPTPLIAAMRCFVASKLGDEVEIPEEFV